MTENSRPPAPVSKRKAASARGAARRLGVEDWTAAALSILLREGVAAITIAKVCEELGVTKGSFYWHFDGIDQLLETTAQFWCADHNDAARGFQDLDELPPRERLTRMGELLTGERVWQVELAVRDWARTNAKVAEAVKALDQRIFHTLAGTLVEMGFSAAQAELRAGVMCFAGIGFVHGNQNLPVPTEEQRREFFRFITSGEG
ncbi:TetR family transcriptional regulator [Nocardia neocaledoniensis NBRC 108232]|uniref:TetR family transcriptional regulator n=1 Tax=Nocardia neocaledoniensis TaxID=236511 RepID=A0A317NKJ0_9NOCA|nr:TetR/AcrR family transcriptional regulator [Nocardia neocaledoniensis]PWV75124.1 TetR family transcriptional regulator [Nocardia neocaledoniensis]GEM34076.1 TetR family transcriptional regulator [Nocardia neocaledoniensis NBRC 108232]